MKLKILLLLLFFTTSIKAQSYFGILAGLDAAKIKEVKNDRLFVVIDTAFTTRSISLGLRYDYTLTKKLFLSLNGTYSQFKINTYELGILPVIKMNFYQIKNSLNINYSILKYWYIGSGLTYSFIPKLQTENIIQSIYQYQYQERQLGLNFATGITFKRLLLDISYQRGLKLIKTNKDFLPIDNITIHAGFMLKMPKVFRKKVVECPRF
jgi:hypothetical protein